MEIKRKSSILNKKALSHVEIIISFVIFIGFLVFFYVIIEPAIKGSQSSSTVLQDLEENFLSQVSEEISVYNLTLNWDEDSDCANIGNCIKIDSQVNKNASVIEKGNSIDCYNNFSYYYTSIWCGGGCKDEDEFIIYYADSFVMKKTNDCPVGLDSKCYTRKFIKKRNYIFENKIETLKNKYGEGIGDSYEQLKVDLNIPSKYDFWFDFMDEIKLISKFTDWKSPDIPENVNVYVSEISITYISKVEQDPEKKKDGFLIIKMWG